MRPTKSLPQRKSPVSIIETGRTVSAVPPAFGKYSRAHAPCNGGNRRRLLGEKSVGAGTQGRLPQRLTEPLTIRPLSWHQQTGYSSPSQSYKYIKGIIPKSAGDVNRGMSTNRRLSFQRRYVRITGIAAEAFQRMGKGRLMGYARRKCIPPGARLSGGKRLDAAPAAGQRFRRMVLRAFFSSWLTWAWLIPSPVDTSCPPGAPWTGHPRRK